MILGGNVSHRDNREGERGCPRLLLLPLHYEDDDDDDDDEETRDSPDPQRARSYEET